MARGIELAQPELDAARHVVGGEHAELHGVRLDVAEQDAQLAQHDVRERGQHLVHALAVLRGQRGDDARAVYAVRAEDLQIGLQPAATGRIGSGDAERHAHGAGE